MGRYWRALAASLLSLVVALLACKKGASEDYEGFTKHAGKHNELEIMLPDGAKLCGPDYKYDCWENGEGKPNFLVTVTKISPEREVTSAQAAREFVTKERRTAKGQNEEAVGDDFYVEVVNKSVVGIDVWYIAKGKGGQVYATCSGSVGTETLKKMCRSLKLD